MPTIHTLEPERRTLHGHFSRDLPPVLTIDPGDTVRFRTLDVGWGLEPFTPGAGRARREVEGRVSPRDDGHALVGPVAIRGAAAGMTLEIQVGATIPGAYGTCFAGGRPSPVNDRLGVSDEGVIHAYTLDASTMTGRNQHGHTVALRPFMGIFGMPPDEPGVLSTIPPRPCGGNIDCKELVADEATMIALEAMVAWIAARYRVGRADAVALTSVAVDLRVTQIVHQVRGVHAVLPHSALR